MNIHSKILLQWKSAPRIVASHVRFRMQPSKVIYFCCISPRQHLVFFNMSLEIFYTPSSNLITATGKIKHAGLLPPTHENLKFLAYPTIRKTTC